MSHIHHVWFAKFRVEANLLDLEKKHKLTRWLPSEQDYRDCESTLAVDKKK